MIRPPAVAGLFYPADRAELAAEVDGHIERAPRRPARAPKAVIAPHAGYVYSGPVAGAAYASLAARRSEVERVVLVGPAHRVPVSGLAVPSADAFATPLGEVPIDEPARSAIAGAPGVEVRDDAHAAEHSLEVQLPFIQRALGSVAVLPVVVGSAGTGVVVEVLERVWGGADTVVVVSSDLSHYQDQATAQRLDAATAQRITGLEGGLAVEDACGAHAVNPLLDLAQRRGMAVELLDLRTSGETAGPAHQVVGYGAFGLAEAEPLVLDEGEAEAVLRLARASVAGEVGAKAEPASLPPRIDGLRKGLFVTLSSGGALRGCVGELEPAAPLGESVQRCAARACHDPRLPRVRRRELADLDVAVSLLGPLERLGVGTASELASALDPGRDGAYVVEGERAATYLPSVWEVLPDPKRFVDELLAKGGWPAGTTDLGGAACYRYEVTEIGEGPR